jgi:hypothetical protein
MVKLIDTIYIDAKIKAILNKMYIMFKILEFNIQMYLI